MQPTQELLQYGVLGVVCVVLLGWIYYKDRQTLSEVKDLREAHRVELSSLRESLSSEQTSRVDDAKAFTTTALDLQQRVIGTITEIRGIVNEYGALSETVAELVAVLKRRNGHGDDRR